jgi:AraC-like DNA-binding protein
VNPPNLSESIPHLLELHRLKNQTVQLGAWPVRVSEHLRFVGILEGKFNWQIEGVPYILYPNDVVVLCPWHRIGNETATLEIGSFIEIALQTNKLEFDGSLQLGAWSALAEIDQRIIGKLLSNGPLVISHFKTLNELLQTIESEAKNGAFGHQTRINQVIDQLFIETVRQLSQQQSQRRDFSQAFGELEKMLRDSLDHPWTVEEMATIVGMSTTAFTEKVKSYSGFSPINYLINIRIAEAMRQIRQTDKSLTDIALDMGFYSSQHFSTTFKKLTGYTPGQYRKAPRPPERE